MGIEELSI